MHGLCNSDDYFLLVFSDNANDGLKSVDHRRACRRDGLRERSGQMYCAIRVACGLWGVRLRITYSGVEKLIGFCYM